MIATKCVKIIQEFHPKSVDGKALYKGVSIHVYDSIDGEMRVDSFKTKGKLFYRFNLLCARVCHLKFTVAQIRASNSYISEGNTNFSLGINIFYKAVVDIALFKIDKKSRVPLVKYVKY